MAMFLTFLLAPLVTALQRKGLGRAPPVILVVSTVGLALGAVMWIVGAQAKSVVDEMPNYTENIKDKIKSLRQMSRGPGTDRLAKMIGEITGELGSPSPTANDGARGSAEPNDVIMRPETPAWLTSVPGLLGRLVEALGGLGMALILLVFMLLKREDLRNRLIRLAGHARMTATTKALDDAGHRISRYLLVQLIVNGIFGLTVAAGLLAIGLPYALLWGFMGFMLRYMPYVGPWIAAILPILLSLIVFEGWIQPFLVIGLFLAVELAINNFVEPRLYGRSIGVSEVALLIAAAFWGFLWGPIGLVLASPLTVCMVVLGKYVPQLEFLDVLLGDEPALAPDVAYYQRLLARDQDEAAELVLAQIKASSLERIYDDFLVPALTYVKRDRQRDNLTESDEQFVLEATREILEDLTERHGAAHAAEGGDAPGRESPIRILACPARDEADRLASEMLHQMLEPAKWEIEVTSVETLASELVALVAKREPGLVCIGALPPGGLAHTRYLCKRLRASFPAIKIIVGRWGFKGNLESNQKQLQEVGADAISTTLLETRSQLASLLPVLAQAQARFKESAKIQAG